MKINVYFMNFGQGRAWIEVFRETYKNIVSKYPDVEFSLIYSENMVETPEVSGVKYGEHFMILEDDETKRYVVISYWDHIWDYTLRGEDKNWNTKDCSEVITSAGTFSSFKTFNPLPVKFTPFSYIPQSGEYEIYAEKLYRLNKRKKIPNKLKFRGSLFELRWVLQNDKRFEVYSIRDDDEKNKLSLQDYLNELNEDYINLSINGAGEICHRDIEILGLGNVLLRTKLHTKFHNDLIPNYHYIAVEHDDIYEKIDNHSYWRHVADRIDYKFNKVKNDLDYLKFIAENGRRWYEENGTIKANADLASKLFDINAFTQRDFWSEQRTLEKEFKKIKSPLPRFV